MTNNAAVLRLSRSCPLGRGQKLLLPGALGIPRLDKRSIRDPTVARLARERNRAAASTHPENPARNQWRDCWLSRAGSTTHGSRRYRESPGRCPGETSDIPGMRFRSLRFAGELKGCRKDHRSCKARARQTCLKSVAPSSIPAPGGNLLGPRPVPRLTLLTACRSRSIFPVRDASSDTADSGG